MIFAIENIWKICGINSARINSAKINYFRVVSIQAERKIWLMLKNIVKFIHAKNHNFRHSRKLIHMKINPIKIYLTLESMLRYYQYFINITLWSHIGRYICFILRMPLSFTLYKQTDLFLWVCILVHKFTIPLLRPLPAWLLRNTVRILLYARKGAKYL